MSNAVPRYFGWADAIVRETVVLATDYDALEADNADNVRRMADDANKLHAAYARIAELEAENVRLLAELDDASPFINCARCAKPDRMHRMCPEEGDEWECVECNDRCNAQEKAALAASNDKGDGT